MGPAELVTDRCPVCGITEIDRYWTPSPPPCRNCDARAAERLAITARGARDVLAALCDTNPKAKP